MPQRILVVAAHPDDELLGAGATLRRHVNEGDDVTCLILGQGSFARADGSDEQMKELQVQARVAGKIIGFHDLRFVSFPDNAFDTVSLLSIVKEVEATFRQVRPEMVYTHHAYDLNVDHRRTFEAVLTASRPCRAWAPHALYTFETLSSSEWQSPYEIPFQPNHFVDISETLETKIEALNAYMSEMRAYPHPRSPEGVRILAQYRGLQCGLRAAEAFCLVRDTRK